MHEGEIYVPELRTAPAHEKPCEIRRYHAPHPSVTQGHHRHPQFLQMRLYGKVKDHQLLWVCGTDHDSIHAWLYYLLGTRPRPEANPGRLVVHEAEMAYEWYRRSIDQNHREDAR